MDLDLQDKKAIVTGGSRGIGKAIARQLAFEGVDVGIAARDQVRVDTAAAELATETGRRIFPWACDTSDDTSARAMVNGLPGELGGAGSQLEDDGRRLGAQVRDLGRPAARERRQQRRGCTGDEQRRDVGDPLGVVAGIREGEPDRRHGRRQRDDHGKRGEAGRRNRLESALHPGNSSAIGTDGTPLGRVVRRPDL